MNLIGQKPIEIDGVFQYLENNFIRMYEINNNFIIGMIHNREKSSVQVQMIF